MRVTRKKVVAVEVDIVVVVDGVVVVVFWCEVGFLGGVRVLLPSSLRMEG
jgi:hypothetical protein